MFASRWSAPLLGMVKDEPVPMDRMAYSADMMNNERNVSLSCSTKPGLCPIVVVVDCFERKL